jgi:hypothetical protein
MYFSAVLFCTSFILMTGCQTNENLQDELKKVENVFHSYFEGICNFDYNSMRSVCTSDFFLVRKLVWEETHFILNGLKVLDSSEASMGGNSFHFEWLESAGFVRVDGEWRINFIDSTTVNPQE